MSAVTIKQAIKTKLDALVTAGTLAGATITDLKKDPLAADIPSYPHAFLMPPSIEAEPLDNRTNTRTYVYDVMIIWKAENITDATTVEDDIETIMNAFDNDPTLSGAAMGGMAPVAMAPQPFQHKNGALIMGVIQVQAKQHVTLTFS